MTLIECAIDLAKFTEQAFVIERPADQDAIADAATRLLARQGLRLDFSGISAKHAQVAATGMPHDVGLLDRATGKVTSVGKHRSAVIAGPVGPAASSDPACLQAVGTWKMLGHVLSGSDLEKAALFAHVLAVRNGIPSAILEEDRAAIEAAETQGPRRGTISTSLRLLHDQRERMEAAQGFMTADAVRISLLVERFTAALPQGRHDKKRPVSPEANLEAGLERRGTSPQLGEAYPTASDLDELPRFEERPDGTAEQGPGYLPPTFNAASRKTAQGVHPDLLMVVARARELSDVEFEVVPKTGGVRTEALQRKLKAAGKSRAKIGRHTIGHAVDLVPTRDGRIDFKDMKGFEAIKNAMAQAAEELNVPIQWGGNWKKLVDKPHFELDRKVYPAPGEESDPASLKVAFR